MNEEKSILKPILVGIIYFLVFVVLVAGIIIFVKSSFPELKGVFHGTLTYVVLLGSLVAVMAAVTSYFDKGTKTRMFFGLSKAGSMILFHLGIYHSMDITIERRDVMIGVDYPGMRSLVILLLVLYAAYFVFEYLLHKGEKEEEIETYEETRTRRERISEPSEVRDDQSQWK
ncbi:MAG: hypothetical protein KGY76_08725 [Candidatus Thermoplasmatota archaeon]|nr:hypothetical protein [Candidatus Thermoplasmatota archaeon]